MCPWHGIRADLPSSGHMPQAVWDALLPYLEDVEMVDLSGGGEPLLNKHLVQWAAQAKARGCRTGFLTNGTLLDKATAEDLLASGIDWLGISLDGATKETYESIRINAGFDTVCENIRRIADLRNGTSPHILINTVMMGSNIHELERFVSLAHTLGVDQINFKQCDVIRGDYGKGLGVFNTEKTPEIRQLEKQLNKAEKLASKKGILVTAFSFTPDEQPVCEQDPRHSLFISHQGMIAPCIGMAYGGETTFLGKSTFMPTLIYGNLLESTLPDIVNSNPCRELIRLLNKRVAVFDQVIASSDYGHSLYKLNQAFEKAVAAMPEPPAACRVCPYLYAM